MATEHLELARSAIAAYNGDDLPALLDLISEEVVATVPLQMANAGVYRGHHGFLRMLEEWGEAWEDFRTRRASRSPHATAWSSPSANMARARQRDRDGHEHLPRRHFRDGRLVRWRLCETREEALAHALGEPT